MKLTVLKVGDRLKHVATGKEAKVKSVVRKDFSNTPPDEIRYQVDGAWIDGGTLFRLYRVATGVSEPCSELVDMDEMTILGLVQSMRADAEYDMKENADCDEADEYLERVRHHDELEVLEEFMKDFVSTVHDLANLPTHREPESQLTYAINKLIELHERQVKYYTKHQQPTEAIRELIDEHGLAMDPTLVDLVRASYEAGKRQGSEVDG